MNKARLVSELSTQLSLAKNNTEERLAHLIDLMCEELDQQNLQRSQCKLLFLRSH